jgi:hypothetical protein
MASSFRTRSLRIAAVCGFIGAASSAYFGMALILAAEARNGSPGGNMLVGTLGLLLLLLTPGFILFGVTVWRASKG